jgi:NAD(P)-dependent dehydrogenase (short-subunit alcohol dehydrogenase family)
MTIDGKTVLVTGANRGIGQALVTEARRAEVYLSRVGSNGVVIGRQDIATVARIKAEYDRLIARYSVDSGHVALPAVAILANGTWVS